MATKCGDLPGTSIAVSSESMREIQSINNSNSVKGKPKLKGRKIKKKHVKKRIRQLETQLKELHCKIMKFQESELSLDEMDDEDSPYIRTDYLMQRFVRDWETLCSLTGTSPQILVDTFEAPKPYEGTPHCAINKKVRRIVDSDQFPDFQDVVDMIAHYKNKYSLPISEEEASKLARTVFTDIGKLIKKRRRYDFLHHFGSHLTDVVRMDEDPSLNNPHLQDKLQKSSEEAKAKLLAIIDDFAIKQVTREQDGHKEEDEEDENHEDDEKDDSEQELEMGGIADDSEEEVHRDSSSDIGDVDVGDGDVGDGDVDVGDGDVGEGDVSDGDDVSDGNNDDIGDDSNGEVDSIHDSSGDGDCGDSSENGEYEDHLCVVEGGSSSMRDQPSGNETSTVQRSVNDKSSKESDNEESLSDFSEAVPLNGIGNLHHSPTHTRPEHTLSESGLDEMERPSLDDIAIVLIDDDSSHIDTPNTPPSKRSKVDKDTIIILSEDDDLN